MKDLITYAIWSSAGRKVTLLGGDAGSATFAAGSSFLVLGVEQATDGSGAATVYLAERKENSSQPSGAREQRILANLKQRLAVRSEGLVNTVTSVPSVNTVTSVNSATSVNTAEAGRSRPRMQVGFGYAPGLDDVRRTAGPPIPSPTRSADDAQGPEV